jgi:hypothetical protein
MADAVRCGCCTPARWRQPPGCAAGSDERHGGLSYATRCNPRVSADEGRRWSAVCAGTASPAAAAHRPPPPLFSKAAPDYRETVDGADLKAGCRRRPCRAGGRPQRLRRRRRTVPEIVDISI